MEEIKSTEKLFLIEQSIKKFKPIINKAADAMRESGMSEYPIFIMHKQVISLGLSLIERSSNSEWAINVSNLEEFVSKKLIFDQKVADFKKTYKDPKEFNCFFVLSDLGAQFLFLKK
jgi:hypothetical protein